MMKVGARVLPKTTPKMIWSLILFQAILIKATVSFASEDNSLSRSAYLVTRENKRLADYVVKQFESPSLMACSQSCLRKPWCTSTNFKKSAGQDDEATCELIKDEFDPINDNSKLTDQPGTIFSLFLKGCLMSGCLNDGSCRFNKKEETFTCSCKRQWSGANCEVDVDGCEAHTHSCSDNAICINTKGSFNCTCKPGYNGNGRNCTEFMNSTILSLNESYFNYLGKFLEPAVGKDSYWLLCWRASLHGWDVDSQFHSRCDGKNNTVTIIQVNKYVFGGYTDIPWESSGSGFRSTSNAFIFSLSNKEGLVPFKSEVTDPSGAIYWCSICGPSFGWNDVDIANNANSNNYSYTDFGKTYSVPREVQDRYTILAGTYNFSPDEVEVFYLYPSH